MVKAEPAGRADLVVRAPRAVGAAMARIVNATRVVLGMAARAGRAAKVAVAEREARVDQVATVDGVRILLSQFRQTLLEPFLPTPLVAALAPPETADTLVSLEARVPGAIPVTKRAGAIAPMAFPAMGRLGKLRAIWVTVIGVIQALKAG